MATLTEPRKRPSTELKFRSTITKWDRLVIYLLVAVPLAIVAFAMAAAWRGTGFLDAKDLVILAVFYLCTSLGITVGFHRMLTHGSFEAPWFVRGILLVFGMWALEGSPMSWVATHTKHHACSDQEDDPHSPLRGFFHAHMWWLLNARVDPNKYAVKQQQDPVARFVSSTAGWWLLLGILLPFALGGWTGLLWGAGVRIFLVHHVTWSVNSVCHTFGSRPFRTGMDRSTNNLVVGIVGMGEGWHNNHHAFPRSAFHGLRWGEFDASGLFIRLLERLSLARNIYRVPADVIRAKRDETARLLSEERKSEVAEQHVPPPTFTLPG